MPNINDTRNTKSNYVSDLQKQAFPQLTSSVLTKQEEPERMKARRALTLGFLNLYQTDALKKKI